MAQKPSETIRIDLIQAASEGGEPRRGPVSSLTRVNWTPPKHTLQFVARTHYKELLQSLYDAALITDFDGAIVDLNDRAVEFFQHPEDVLRTMHIHEIIHGADEDLLALLRETLEKEQHSLIQAYCVRRDGSYFPAEIAVNRLRLEKIRLCFFIRDITARTQAEEMLRLEHRALEITACAVVLVEAEGHVHYANPAAAALLGYEDAGTLLGIDAQTLFAVPETAAQLFGQALESDAEFSGNVELRTAGGAALTVPLVVASQRSMDGEPLGIVLVFTPPATT